jgi:outer membrane protein assembly factor BamD (BamD/ComL family)
LQFRPEGRVRRPQRREIVCRGQGRHADAGSYERAIKALERVEGLGAGTLLAQQAQLDLAYLYWKTNGTAQALSTIERFIKYNPSSPASTTRCTCAA